MKIHDKTLFCEKLRSRLVLIDVDVLVINPIRHGPMLEQDVYSTSVQERERRK